MSNIGKKLTAVTAVCLLGAAGLWFASTPLREALQEDVQTMPSAKTGDPLDDTGAPVSAGTQPDAQDAQAVFQPLFPGLESASIRRSPSTRPKANTISSAREKKVSASTITWLTMRFLIR